MKTNLYTDGIPTQFKYSFTHSPLFVSLVFPKGTLYFVIRINVK